MLKLFITLYLMVFASFALFIVAVSNVENLGRFLVSGTSIEERVSIGSLTLLNQAIEGKSKSQRKQIIDKYKKIFGKEFKLINLAEKHFSKDQINILNKGKVLVTFEEIQVPVHLNSEATETSNETIVYFKVPDTSLIWRVNLSIDVNQSIDEKGISTIVSGGKFAEGIFTLIEEKLKDQPESSWSTIIKNLQKIHKIKLNIKPLSSLHGINNKQLKSIQEGKIVNITQRTKEATFIHKIANSSMVIQFGPAEIPWYMRNFLYIALFIFLISFATMLLLWIYPLWSNLTNLKKASEHFGKGNYDTRISYSIFSPITKVSKAFNAMAERTQRGIDAQKELTSAISHELRTPVARMRFALEMLEDSATKADTTRFIHDINTDIDELDMLLEELLTYARLDHGKSNYKQDNLTLVTLASWFKETMRRLEPLATTKKLSYKVQGITENETTLIEPRLMTRVVDNLVQNAIRYAKNTIKVTLSKEFTEDNKDFLIIIEDDGKGIPKDKQNKIFDAFTRIDESRNRASGGFGLGLAIANRIIINHQGTIKLHTSNLGGACFIIRIPLKTKKTY